MNVLSWLAGYAAGVLALAMLAGQAYAWVERRRIDWVGETR